MAEDNMNKTSHIQRTAEQMRQRMKVPARISSIVQKTPTVKIFQFQLQESLSFLPGQWCDFFIPSLKQVGGFSYTSLPRQAEEDNMVELAIKESDSGPTLWLHKEAKVGDAVEMRVGGNFHFEADTGEHHFLIAAGIGITPLWSILQFYAENCSSSPITMFYVSQQENELVYLNEMQNLAKSYDHIRCFFRTTREQSSREEIEFGRFSQSNFESNLSFHGKSAKKILLCGPAPFTDDMVKTFEGLGFSDEQIFYEKWW